jgi:hypothetical protein
MIKLVNVSNYIGNMMRKVINSALNTKNYSCNLLSRMLYKSTLIQLLLIIITASIFILTSYQNWKNKNNKEINEIKHIITYNMDLYNEITDLVIKKMTNTNSNIREILNYRKYNEIFSSEDKYVHIDGISLIDSNKSVINSQNSKEDFVILPPKEFFEDLNLSPKQRSYLQDNILYVGRSFKTKDNATSYILIKIAIDNFIKKTSHQVGLVVGVFKISNYNLDIESIEINEKMFLIYQKSSFVDSIIAQKNLIISILIGYLLFSFTWIFKVRSFFSQIISNSYDKQNSLNEKNSIIQKENDTLILYNRNLELSFNSNRALYSELLFSL